MAKKQFNLETELTAKIDDLTAKLNRASSQIEGFKKKNQSSGTDIKNIWSGVSTGIAGVGAAYAAAKGVLEGFNSVIESNQATSDAFAVTMAQINASFDYMAGSIGEMDFTNFFDNLKLTNEAAVQLAETLDLLGDINRSDAITTAKEETRLFELQNIFIDKKLDKQKRLNALTEYSQIKQQAVTRELDKQKTEFDATLNSVTKLPSYINKYGTDTKAALQLLEGYGDAWRSGTHEKASNLNALQSEANTKHYVYSTSQGIAGSTIRTPDYKADAKALEAYKSALQSASPAVKQWAELLKNVQINDKGLESLSKLSVRGEQLKGQAEAIQVENTRTRNKVLGYDEFGLSSGNVKIKAIKSLSAKTVGKVDRSQNIETDKLNENTRALLENADAAQRNIEIYNSRLSNTEKSIDSFVTWIDTVDVQGKNLTDTLYGIGDAVSNLGSIFGEQTIAYKAFAMTEALINTFLGVSQVFADKTLPTFLKPILAGTILAAGLANVSKLAGVFENGGIVGGSSFSGDNLVARVNSGEMILNRTQQANLFKMLNSNLSSGNGEVIFRIDGNTLVGVLNNQNKRINNMK